MRWRKIAFEGNDVRQQKSCRKTTTTSPRLWLVFAVLVLFCAAGVGTTVADTQTAGTFEELSGWISNATGERTIVITGDMGVGSTEYLEIGSGKSVTLVPAGTGDYRIYRAAASSPTISGLFVIRSGGNLKITDNGTRTLILDGSGITSNTKPLVYVGEGGTFTLAGGTITNNTVVSASGGGVLVYNSTFTMEGGEITNNTAKYGGDDYYPLGGGVYVYNSTFTMEGGEISGNTANVGGGVCVSNDSTFTLVDGEISGNTADYGGGGVNSWGIFMMSGGEIANNTADYGGGVANLEGKFTIVGGTITNNTAPEGGGVDNDLGATFTMSDSALIDATNEFWLGTNIFINVTGPLTGGAKNITVGNPVVGIKVIELPASTADVYRSNFILSPAMASSYALEYNASGSTPIYELVTLTDVTFSALQTGGASGTADSAGIVLTFSQSVAGLTADDITVTGDTGAAVKGTLTGSGTEWTIGLASVTTEGDVTVSVADFGAFSVATSPQIVAVYKDNVVPPAVTPTVPPTTPPTIPPASGDGGSTQNSFRVLFETSGGSTVAPVTGLSYGDRITAPAAPVKEGYTFGGWYRNEACTASWTFADAVPGDITLYAKWIRSGATPTTTATVTVTTSPTVITTTTVTAAMTATATESPTATQAPAPVFGVFAGMVAAGVMMRRRLL